MLALRGDPVLDKILDRLSKTAPVGDCLEQVHQFAQRLPDQSSILKTLKKYITVGCCDLRSETYSKGNDPLYRSCAATWCWTCATFRTTDFCTIFRCYECYGADVASHCLEFGCYESEDRSSGPSTLICSKAVNTFISCRSADGDPAALTSQSSVSDHDISP